MPRDNDNVLCVDIVAEQVMVSKTEKGCSGSLFLINNMLKGLLIIG